MDQLLINQSDWVVVNSGKVEGSAESLNRVQLIVFTGLAFEMTNFSQ